MQHSAVDLEHYARLYTQDRLRVAAWQRRVDEAVTDESMLKRLVAHIQSWFTPAPREVVAPARSASTSRPAQLVPELKKPQASSADPYAGMIVLVRGPKEPCSLDAA
jgi:hypothetical protein